MDTPMANLNNQILEALQNDSRTKKAIIEVAVLGGIVTLTGTVKSGSIRQAAEAITRNQEGVISVVDELKVGG